jgi:hypothetical protein
LFETRLVDIYIHRSNLAYIASRFVVSYGCKTWSLPIKGSLLVFENRVLRRIFGPKRDETRGGWRKLQNEELHKLYFSLNQFKEGEMGRPCGKHRREEVYMQAFGGKAKRKETTRKA